MNAMNIYAFADEASGQISGQIAAMCRNGLQGLEIRGVDGQNISDISMEKARKVRSRLDDAGLRVWSMGSPIGKISIESDGFAAHLDKLRHTLVLADVLGAKNLRMFSFYMPEEEADHNRQQVIDRMGQFLEIAKSTGIALCHENEKGIYGCTADRCLDLLTVFPDLKGIFDPANYVQCHDDTARGWELLKHRTYYLHIKDALDDGSVVPAGKGLGNVPAIVKDFLARGGNAMTIEPHLKVFDGLAGLEQEGDTSVVGKKYTYPTADAAFDAACDAVKHILQEV